MSLTRRPARWVAALPHRLGLDGNPLRRRTDRVESWIRLVLVAVFLVGSPLAGVALGQMTSEVSARAARAEAASKHRVTAVLLERAPRTAADSLYPSDGFVLARARWMAPDGRPLTGEVPVPAGSPRGRHRSIWVDWSGRLVWPPIGAGEIVSRVVAVVALTPAVLAILLALALWAARRLLDRRRLAGWATEWSAVEPQWTNRSS